MPAYIADAIEIITDDGTGIPVAYANTALGLSGDGRFYLITDRFDLDGGKTITGDTTRTVWYESILSHDLSSFSITMEADFVESGCIASNSGFSFSIVNTSLFFDTLKTNGVYLSNREIKYYRVTASNLAGPFNFELRWSGLIEDQPFNELTQKISCIDNSKNIFRSLPSLAVNNATFPNAPKDSQEKMIPIALGRVSYSPLINVSGGGNKEVLCKIDGIDYNMCACSNSGVTSENKYYVDLLTKGLSFVVNDYRLINKHLVVVYSGEKQIVRITENTVTSNTTTPLVSELTRIIISDPLKGFGTSSKYNTSSSSQVWYFQILDLSPNLIASKNEIYDYKNNVYNRESLYVFNKDVLDFEDVTHIKSGSSLSNINSVNHPGFTTVSSSLDSEDSTFGYVNITPLSCEVISNAMPGGNLPAPGSYANDLIDVDAATYYTLTNNVVGGTTNEVSFYLTFPKDEVVKQYKELYLLADFSHSHSTVGYVQLFATVSCYDFYGRVMTTTVDLKQMNQSVILDDYEALTTETTWNLLSGEYYNAQRDDAQFFKNKLVFNIAPVITDTKALNVFNKIKVVYTFQMTMVSGSYTAKIKEIGLIGKRAVSITESLCHSNLIGETFKTTWNGRRTSGQPILNIVDAYEHLIRNYDEYQDAWKAAKDYIVGDKIKSTADNSNVFICITAGVSHASTEPSWTATVGATYTDNTVTWRQYKALSINEASFDTAKTLRTDWLVGSTITDKRQSIEYYNQMLKQSFIISFISASGKIKLKPWLDNITPSITFNASNIIPNTLSDVTLTPIRRSYNEFKLNYDWNYGSKKFNKSISITNVDRPAFPSTKEVVGNKNALASYSMAISWGGGDYYALLVTSAAHGLESGDYVYLDGTSNGNDFDLLQVIVASGNEFYMVTKIAPNSMAVTTSGIMYRSEVNNLKWKTYVTGIDNYNTAKTLWTRCNESYRFHKVINKLPDDLSDCNFYFDPYALDPIKKYIWQTDEALDLDIGDEHATFFYLTKLVEWVTWRKKQVYFNVPDNSTYSAVELGDPVYVNDAKLTNGIDLLGWVHSKRQNPRSEKNIESFTFGVTFKPEEFVDHYVIDENFATDIIDENGATNIYDENGA